MRRGNLHVLAWGLTAAYATTLYVLTHTPQRPGAEAGGVVNDKLAHFVAYGVLGALIYWSLHLGDKRRGPRWIAVRVLLIGMIFAIVDELTQIPVGRTASVKDWHADVIGLALSLVIAVPIHARFFQHDPPGAGEPGKL